MEAATALIEAQEDVEKAAGEEEDDENVQDGKEKGGKGEVWKFELFVECARPKVGENFEEVAGDEEEDVHEVGKGVDEKYGRNLRLILLHSGHCLLTEQRH